MADVQPLAIAARAAGADVLVRTEPNRLDSILDAGVEGIVAPKVESAAEAAELVARLRYPPAGRRGFAARRAFARTARPSLWVQIEAWEAAERASEIASVDGVDALVVGCADLSLSLGEAPLGTSPALERAVALVQDGAERAGVPSGIAGPADRDLLLGLAAGRSEVLVMAADVRIYMRALEELRDLREEPADVCA